MTTMHMMFRFHLIAAAVFVLALVAACSPSAPQTTNGNGNENAGAPAANANTEPGETGPPVHKPESLHAAGLHNLFRLADDLYSGAQPDGADGFASLKKLGVKTIVTVDGAIPDIDGAAAEGIRYIHLPIGYDGISPERRAEIVRAVQLAQADGPVFVHCHHGKHRGVAAAAICAIGLEGYSADDALGFMHQAGTGENYKGLWKAAREFAMPSADELAKLPTEFPNRAETGDMVKVMNAIDERWEHLGAVRSAGFSVPPDHPDIDPPHEALQLMELFREMARTDEAKALGADFLRHLQEAEVAATRLSEALTAFGGDASDADRAATEAAHKAVGGTCSGCHAAYRNNR